MRPENDSSLEITTSALHNGMSRTIKIFKKVELWVSMARLTPNLVNASQKKWKKRKKGFEIGGIWTPDQPQMNKK